MRLKIITAILLALCFGWLALLTGAVPLLTRADAASADATADEPSPEASSPAVAPEPSPSPEAPAVLEEPSEETAPEDTPAPTEEPQPPQIVSTTITSERRLDNHTYYDIDADDLLAEGVDLVLPAEGYQVLILHTHATEAYTPEAEGLYSESDAYRTTDPDYSVLRVGEELAEALSAYGLNVLHDTALYDHPSYSGSYARSGAAVEEYLAAYPDIRLVIDLHRDALGDGETIYRTLADIDGVYAAQIMFVMGSDVNLEHPAWRDNLALALTLQAAVQARYPTLMRPTVLCDYRYNQQLSPGCLLMEVGTSGNTLSEALEAVRRFAEAAGPVMASWIAE